MNAHVPPGYVLSLNRIKVVAVAIALNSHVGAAKEGCSCYGGFGYEARNAGSERIPQYADTTSQS